MRGITDPAEAREVLRAFHNLMETLWGIHQRDLAFRGTDEECLLVVNTLFIHFKAVGEAVGVNEE